MVYVWGFLKVWSKHGDNRGKAFQVEGSFSLDFFDGH